MKSQGFIRFLSVLGAWRRDESRRGTHECVRHVGRLMLGLLREIGDESAYARHLTAHGVAHSGEEWRRFSEKRMAAKYSRAKCC